MRLFPVGDLISQIRPFITMVSRLHLVPLGRAQELDVDAEVAGQYPGDFDFVRLRQHGRVSRENNHRDKPWPFPS